MSGERSGGTGDRPRTHREGAGATANEFRPATEEELVQILRRRLRSDWPVRADGLEVRSHGRCRTDLCVTVRPHGQAHVPDLLLGIEAKLTDWPRAVRQAALNRYVVDASFVAVPEALTAHGLLTMASFHGVGVLGVSARGVAVRLPAQLGVPDSSLRARALGQLFRTKARGRRATDELVQPQSEISDWGVA